MEDFGMIEGINPIHISKITVGNFHRDGYHPLVYKLLKRKGVYGKIIYHLIDKSEDNVAPAHVNIAGGSRTLKCITCKSRAEAEALAARLNDDMTNWLNNIITIGKLYDCLNDD